MLGRGLLGEAHGTAGGEDRLRDTALRPGGLGE